MENLAFTPVPEGAALLLNGNWQCRRYPFDESLAAQPGDTTGWETVVQPGKVFYADPEADRDPDPKWNRVTLDHISETDGAVLVRQIPLPATWQGKTVKLRFDAIYPGGVIYVNGTKVGEHFSGLTPFEADVTALVTPGQTATVAVRLYRKHKFVKMDMCRHSLEFAGMAQDAYLFAVAPTHVADYHLITTLAPDRQSGKIAGTVRIANPQEGGKLTVALDNGVSAAIPTHANQSDYAVELAVPSPRLWSDEFPNLYTVTLTLGGERCSYRTGFRTLGLSPVGAKLNGNFVKFRGVNHLTFHPQSGLYTPAAWLRKDLELMKKANVNAIRTHFTAPPALADLCDEMGFYLLQEIPIDWGTNYIQDPEWVPPALFRIESVVRRDRHHPSLMVWCVGNENMPPTKATAQAGWDHLKSYEGLCHQLDPSRPTMFPPPGPANAIRGIFELRVGEIADTHYSFNLQKDFNRTGDIVNPNSWEGDMVRCTREWALKRGWSGCWFSSEYGLFNAEPDLLHAPYCSVIDDLCPDPLSGENSLEVFHRRLKNEWGNMRHDPTCLGGAYFPWLCAGSYADPDNPTWSWGRMGEDANWGVVTPDLLPKPQFWALRVLLAPVWFPARVSWKPGDEAITFPVQNQYNGIDLSECTFRTQQNGGGKWMSMVRQFQDVPVAAKPGETVQMTIPLWSESVKKALNNGNFGYCRITMLDPKGFCVVKADVLIIPEAMQRKDEAGMPLGPDAILN